MGNGISKLCGSGNEVGNKGHMQAVCLLCMKQSEKEATPGCTGNEGRLLIENHSLRKELEVASILMKDFSALFLGTDKWKV